MLLALFDQCLNLLLCSFDSCGCCHGRKPLNYVAERDQREPWGESTLMGLSVEEWVNYMCVI